MTKFKKSDFHVGMVVVTENGNKYAVSNLYPSIDVINVYDAAEREATLCSNYVIDTFEGDKLAVHGGTKNGSRVVKEIYDFANAVPDRNRLSEALKIAIGRPASYTMKKIWDNSACKYVTQEQLAKIIQEVITKVCGSR